MLRDQARAERQRLVQKILRGAHGKPKSPKTPEPPAETTPEGDPAEPAVPREPAESEPESEGASEPDPEPEAGHRGCWREHS